MRAAEPVTGAFLAVAFADGRYDPSEEQRFLATIANDPTLSCVRSEALQEAYNVLLHAFENDFATAAERVLELICGVKNDSAIAAAVKTAARGAVVADERVAPQEELMLGRIAEALGVEQGSI